jgi:cytoskeletal protein RodZ
MSTPPTDPKPQYPSSSPRCAPDDNSSGSTGSRSFQERRKVMMVKYPKYLMMLAPVLVVLVMALSYIALAQEHADTDSPASFAELAADLKQMSNFFGGGQNASQPVTFDVEAARAAGFPEESILLAADLAGFSNQIVQDQRNAVDYDEPITSISNFYRAATTDYPRVKEFLQLATEESARAASARSPGHDSPSCSLGDAKCTCGWFDSPRPPRAIDRVWMSVVNPEDTLLAWGYHPPPRFAD